MLASRPFSRVSLALIVWKACTNKPREVRVFLDGMIEHEGTLGRDGVYHPSQPDRVSALIPGHLDIHAMGRDGRPGPFAGFSEYWDPRAAAACPGAPERPPARELEHISRKVRDAYFEACGLGEFLDRPTERYAFADAVGAPNAAMALALLQWAVDAGAEEAQVDRLSRALLLSMVFDYSVRVSPLDQDIRLPAAGRGVGSVPKARPLVYITPRHVRVGAFSVDLVEGSFDPPERSGSRARLGAARG